MSTTQDLLENYEKLFFQELSLIKNQSDLESFRIRHLGRNGLLSQQMHTLTELPLEQKKILGPVFNTLKEKAQRAFKEKEDQLVYESIAAENLKHSNFDVTAYKPFQLQGSLHPYTQVIEFVEDIFISMGFEIVDGPEVDRDFFNFEALNIPADHPARDMQDTFWLTLPGFLMRTHTSSVWIHTMLNKKPPLAIAVPGRAYRNEATDASHDFMFLQLEMLLIDKNVTLAQLTSTIKTFLQTFFKKKELSIRIRPSYFPFVEPGIEVDMTCPFCTEGCSVCKKTRWIEVGGAGLTHPSVLKACDIDTSVYNGFAFGLGLTRLVMLKYGIKDVRLLHSNKIEFLEQF